MENKSSIILPKRGLNGEQIMRWRYNVGITVPKSSRDFLRIFLYSLFTLYLVLPSDSLNSPPLCSGINEVHWSPVIWPTLGREKIGHKTEMAIFRIDHHIV